MSPSKHKKRPLREPQSARGPKRSTQPGDPAREWVGGLVSLPTYVTGEGEPYRPEALCWLDAEGIVRCMLVDRPGKLLGRVSESLEQAMKRPLGGLPGYPLRLRVNSAELAESLRAERPNLPVVVAPTPELKELVAQLTERLGADAEADETYFAVGVGEEQLASFFSAAARLYQAAPWAVVPRGRIASVSLPALDLKHAVLVVYGTKQSDPGLALFGTLEQFGQFLDGVGAREEGEIVPLAPHLSLSFRRAADLPASAPKECADHGWQVAAADAYPWPTATDESLVSRPPIPEELTVLELLAQALPPFSALISAAPGVWDDGEPVTLTQSIVTSTGQFEITLRVPHEHEGPFPDDLLGALRQLETAPDEVLQGYLESALLERFADAPEAQELGELDLSPWVLDLGASHLGVTIGSITPAQLAELVFEVLPKNPVIPLAHAPELIREFRAFFTFLGREFGHPLAAGCLEVLGDGAIERLTAALSAARKRRQRTRHKKSARSPRKKSR